jgi:two-component system, chemotaxis family, sensor kinase CheA
MDAEAQSLLNEFVTESRENLQLAEKRLLALEDTPDPETVNELFRAIHTVKGAAGFFKLGRLGRLAHVGESLLSKVRDGKLVVSRPLVDLLLETVDVLLGMLDRSDLGESTESGDLLSRLESALGTAPATAAPAHSDCAGLPNVDMDLSQAVEAVRKRSGHGKLLYAMSLDPFHRESVSPDGLQGLLEQRFAGVIFEVHRTGDFPAALAGNGRATLYVESLLEPDLVQELLQVPANECVRIPEAECSRLLAPQPPPLAMPHPSAVMAAAPATAAHGSSAPSTIRIGVEVLDELLELIGEVVLGRNQLITRHQDDPVFKSLSRSITRLHQHVIRTRMQNVGSLFERYRRTVRDISQQLGKKVDITIEGGDIELDRTVLESLADPLTHLVRNSVDHGLESVEERSRSGKQVVGSISLRALHESGQVMIEVEDDGRGIDSERVRAKAVEKGLVTAEEAAQLTDKEVVAFIFHPGFSTKDTATELSGRGVGMDVVKTNLVKLGCSVEVSSRPGKGTVVSISIPLTQAMVNSSVISGLIVGIDRYTLAIPQLAVNEVVRLAPGDRARRIESVQGREVFKLRDKVIPLVHLEDILGLPRTFADPDGGSHPERRTRFSDRRGAAPEGDVDGIRRGDDRRRRSEIFIVLHYKQNWFGILVDKIVGTEEIVVRRPPEILKGRRIFSGSTILGNGTVSLILDIGGMVEAAKLDFADRTRSLSAHMRRSSMREVEQRVVVFSNSDDEFFAIPVNLLSEIDRCTAAEIRPVGSREFIQRHGASVPLLRLEKHLDVTPLDPGRKSFVVMTPSRLTYPTAIVAGRIEGTLVLGDDINTKEADERGLMGTFFRDGRLVSLLDIYSLLQKSDPDHYKSEMRPDTQSCRILLAEDQLFFRQLVVQYFKSHGIRTVVTVADGRQAIDELSRNPGGYDVVVSDIEMPVMNGYQLVSMIKSDPRLSHLPVMALTSLEGQENVQKGFEAGFDAYEIKLDKDKVVRCLDKLLASGPRKG